MFSPIMTLPLRYFRIGGDPLGTALRMPAAKARGISHVPRTSGYCFPQIDDVS